MNVFIISYNRLSFLREQIKFFRTIPGLHLHIVDNGSTYPPLIGYLQYLSCYSNITVHYMKHNYGHRVVWEKDLSRQICPDEPYMVTDNDVIPEYPGFISILKEGLFLFPDANKIGLGLRTDDLPEGPIKDQVIKHEIHGLPRMETSDARFIWMPVDTTMAIYRSGYHDASPWGTSADLGKLECRAMRTTTILARHLSWYITPAEVKSEENQFYFNSLKNGSTHWSRLQGMTKNRRR